MNVAAEVVTALVPIANDTEFEVPPPGAGLETVILAVPTEATSAADTLMVKRVLLTNVVVRSAPFHLACELPTNPDPIMLSTNAPDPDARAFGSRLVMTGVGFGAGVGSK